MAAEAPTPPPTSAGWFSRITWPLRMFGRGLRWCYRIVALVAYWLLGRYTPPPWLRFLFRSPALLVRHTVRLLNAWRQRHRPSFIVAMPLIVAVLAGLLYYAVRPVPPGMDVSVSSPGPTRLEDGSTPEPVHLDFDGSAARLDQIGKTLKTGVSLSPALQGAWRWDSDRRLTFTPEEDWGVGQRYTVTLDRTLFPSQVQLRRYSYTFHSAPFRAKLIDSRFFQDPTDPTLKKVVATVRFSHPVDVDDFRGRVRVVMEDEEHKEGWLSHGLKLGSEVTFNALRTEAYIHSARIQIPPKDATVKVIVDSGARAARGGPAFDETLTAQVPIPGVESFFHVVSAKPILVDNQAYDREQVLVVTLSTGVAPKALRDNLSVYVLPVDRPAMQGLPAEKNYAWEDTTEIGKEVLDASTPLKLDPIANQAPYPALQSFRFRADEHRYLYIRIGKGTKAPGGFALPRAFDTIVQVPPYPREARIVNQGALLSLGGDHKISIASRNLPALGFVVGRVKLSDITHLVTQSNGKFESPDFKNWDFNSLDITERVGRIKLLASGKPGEAQFSSFDFSDYLSRPGKPGRGLFLLEVHGWDPASQTVIGDGDHRLVLVTDLGLLVKVARNGTQDVFVQSLQAGAPVSGARVQVLGRNGSTLIEGRTDAQGHLSLPSLRGLQQEKQPTVYLVTKGDDLSFMPYSGFERQLELSRFDVGGEVTSDSGPGLDAYLFSDRGIYRPGEAFHVGMIVKATNWHQSLQGVPLEAVVTDPRGLEVERKRIRLSESGFEELSYRTEEASPTGNYSVNLYVVKDGKRGSQINGTQVRVEEFVPDNLRIHVRFDPAPVEGWVAPQGLKARISLRTLFGQPAAGRRIAPVLTLSPQVPHLAGFPGFTFYDPLRADKQFHERLQTVRTDAQGEAEIPLPLERFAKATYLVDLSADGYEAEGGRAVTARARVLVSPLKYLIGYKPDGDLSYVHKGAKRVVDIVAVDPSLNRTAVSDLQAELVERRFVSVLTRQEDGTFRYESVRKEYPVKTSRLEIPAQGLAYVLPSDQAGDYLLRVKAHDGTELSKIAFTVVGPGQLARTLEKNAELQIRLNKSDYAPGEDIELQIRAPYVGAGLITIERDRIYAFKWFRSTTDTTVQHIRVPKGLEGNAYVNVTFVRSLDSREIFMSPLSYGVVPFTLSRASRTNVVKLTVPRHAKPGETLHIGYEGSRPGRIVVFAVDEGILQVARYHTPDPLGHFFRKRALEVTTSQILDQILPEYGVVRALAAPGGGMSEAAAMLARNLNPFRRQHQAAVAFWSGLLPLDRTEREVSFKVPDSFNGTLRVMAVAVSPDALGVARRPALVRGPFVITPNVPTFVAPGDEFQVGVNVANNLEGKDAATNVKVMVEASDALSLLDGATRELQVPSGAERSGTFRIKAKAKPGAARLTFRAISGEHSSRYSVELSVRPATPYLTTVSSGYVSGGKAELTLKRRLYPEKRTLSATASSIPLGLSRGLLDYLHGFPYLCTEQLVSKAFPVMVLQGRPELGANPKEAEKTLAKLLGVLQARQTGEGAFSLWAAHTTVEDLPSVYAMHFLTEMRAQGHPLPARLLRRGLVYLRELARRQPGSLPEARVQAYAIYVLTRNGVVTTSMVDDLRKTLEAQSDWKWQTDLTGIYLAATYRLLHQDEQASALIGKNRLGIPQQPDYDYLYDGLVRDSQLLYILARHFPERLQGLKGSALESIVKPIVEDHYNTISSAYTVLALNAYAKAVGNPQAVAARIEEVRPDGSAHALKVPAGLFPKVAISGDATRVRFTTRGEHPLFYQLTESGFDLKPPTKEIKDGLEVQREYRNEKGEVVTHATLGEKLEVRLHLRALGDRTLRNVAVVDMLPGGFEVDPTSIHGARPEPAEAPAQASTDEGTPQNMDAVLRNLESRRGLPPGTLHLVRSDNGDIRIAQSGPEDEQEQAPAERPRFQPYKPAFPEHLEPREDRVLVFGAVGEAAQEFSYRIRATNAGRFAVPPPFAESMYDRSVRARGLGATIEVSAAP